MEQNTNTIEIEGIKFEKDQLGVHAEKGEKGFRAYAEPKFWVPVSKKEDPTYGDELAAQKKNIDELWAEAQKHLPGKAAKAEAPAEKKA